MSKGNSGLFTGTIGSQADFIQSLERLLSISDDEGTAVVWDHINAIQKYYEGTVIPRYFELDVPKTKVTPEGKVWTHGNATEHIYEAVTSIRRHAPSIVNSNPNLYSQFILYDYYKSLGKAVRKGFDYGSIATVGNWEFIIVKPRNGQKYPVVKHALFTGLEK